MAHSLRNPLLCLTALLLIGGASVPGSPGAVCVKELRSCMHRVQEHLGNGITELDWRLIRDANMMACDCSIDAYHHIMLGNHDACRCAA